MITSFSFFGEHDFKYPCIVLKHSLLVHASMTLVEC